MEDTIKKENLEEYNAFNHLIDKTNKNQYLFKENIPLIQTLILLTKADEAKNILEIGCAQGVGTHTIFSQNRSPGNIVGIDISDKMLAKAVENFKANVNFTCNPHNQLQLLSVKANEKITLTDNAEGKTLTLIQCDCESIPYVDEQFDSYICSLTLHHADDYTQSVKEAYRVLKKGGKFGVGEFGDKSQNIYNLIYQILEKYGLKTPSAKIFRIADDIKGFIKICSEAGFKNIKYGYTNIFKANFDKDNVVKNLHEKIKIQLNELKDKDKDKYEALMTELNNALNQYFVVDNKVAMMNCICIFGEK